MLTVSYKTKKWKADWPQIKNFKIARNSDWQERHTIQSKDTPYSPKTQHTVQRHTIQSKDTKYSPKTHHTVQSQGPTTHISKGSIRSVAFRYVATEHSTLLKCGCWPQSNNRRLLHRVTYHRQKHVEFNIIKRSLQTVIEEDADWEMHWNKMNFKVTVLLAVTEHCPLCL
jgi:hypothetical protein